MAVPADEPSATLVAEPAEAEIGQPVDWVLTVRHPARDSVRLAEEGPLPDETWVLLDGPRITTERDAAGGARTELRWSVFSLEPGARELPALAIRLASGLEVAVARPGTLTVRAALAEGEDAPRPPTGFHEVRERAGPARPWHAGVALLVLAAGIGAWIVRKKRARATEEREPPALERLAALGARAADEPEAARSLTFALSALVRGAVDEKLCTDQIGLTDEEWLARVAASARIPAATLAELEALVARCDEVKYGGHAPTRLAIRESLARAERILFALADEEREAAA